MSTETPAALPVAATLDVRFRGGGVRAAAIRRDSRQLQRRLPRMIAYTGRSFFSRCIFSWNRSVRRVCSISGNLLGGGACGKLGADIEPLRRKPFRTTDW